MGDEGRRARNLVLSVCDFKLQQHSLAPSGEGPPGALGGPGGPQGRVGSRLIVGRGTQLLLHGGADEVGCYSDLHAIELERATCKELLVGGFSKPTGRFGHSLLAFGDSAILFGGLAEPEAGGRRVKSPSPPFLGSRTAWYHQPQPSEDLFSLQLDNLEWTQPETEGLPPQPRSFHAAAICSECMLIFGGVTDSAFSEPQNDLHLLDLSTWRWCEARDDGDLQNPLGEEGAPGVPGASLEFVLRGPSPSPRYGHAMFAIPKQTRCLMFGGAEDDGALWALDLTFTQQPSSSSNGPEQGSSSSSRSNSTPCSVVLRRVEAVWSRVETYLTGPQSRRFHSFVLVGSKRVFVFGGRNVSRPNDPAGLYVLDLNSCRWSRPMYEGSVCLCAQSDAVLHDKLILFGGANAEYATKLSETSGKSAGGDTPETASTISRRLLFLSVLEIKEGVSDNEYRFKLVTVGDSGVGKSCLLTRFVQDEFSDFHVSTIGVDFRSIATMIRGRMCTLQLWDTAGQERFSGVTGNYYRNADGFVLVFDATLRQSFEHLTRWLAQIKEHHDLGPGTVLLLVGNKMDLEDKLVVTDEEAQQFAASIGATYVSTSAKTSANVDSAFLLVASKLAEKRRAAAAAARNSSSSTADTPAAAETAYAVSLTASPSRVRSLCSGCGGLAGRTTGPVELTDVGVRPAAANPL